MRPVAWIAVTAVLYSGAHAAERDGARVLSFPFGSKTKVASPDGRFVLFGLPYATGNRKGPELWIRNERTGDRHLLLSLNGTVRAEWAPDGSAFYVVDRLASDSTLSYIYDPTGTTRLDVREALMQADPELQPYVRGHVYVRALKWLNSKVILVSYFGHRDEPPVRCFEFRYTVNRVGHVTRLSRHVSLVTNRGCPGTPGSG